MPEALGLAPGVVFLVRYGDCRSCSSLQTCNPQYRVENISECVAVFPC